MKILGIIPARYASTRFPGKPLADIHGKPMVVRVCEQASMAGKLADILVATDDERIRQAVVASGFQAVMTSPMHESGTARCMEALEHYNRHHDGPAGAVINIQGDEPFIHPDHILGVAALLEEGHAQIATLAKKMESTKEIADPNVVKVVFSASFHALYFSRSPIPFLRGIAMNDWQKQDMHYKHIGIYGYTARVLGEIGELERGRLETAESLEQLRWLEHGYSIRIGITDKESLAVDTPADLLKITNMP